MHKQALSQQFRCLTSLTRFSAFKRRYCQNESDLQRYDVIVVGGGHAGTEACHASARMGVRTLLVTHKTHTIGVMSCNPSFGGIGKGHLIREIDALDGVCGKICDKSGVQYRVLNRRKGPAVWGLRAQLDRELYLKNMQEEIFKTPNLDIVTGSVDDLIIEQSIQYESRCSGVVLGDGRKYYSDSVVLTTGTFLQANINIGLESRPAGRIGDEPAIELANTLRNLQFRIGRLRTGTPPRLKKSSINFEKLAYVCGDDPSVPFSFLNDSVWIKPENQLRCYLTYTNETVENICLASLTENRHVREEVQGPRYCPSIESKAIKWVPLGKFLLEKSAPLNIFVYRFGGRKHQIWLEPEGLDSPVIYPGGMSCTMKAEMQERLVHAIPGLEKAVLLQHGYGVEYEFVDPRELSPSLETKKVAGLFFAGQINGTTGYEEAAAQGIIAGINAAVKAQGKPKFLISRTEGYIGVLIDDLTSLGTNEPYRMFTARSEFRLYLRPDNADLRLTKKVVVSGYEIGCVSEERYKYFCDVEREFINGLEILSSVNKSTFKWKRSIGIDPGKSPETLAAIDVFRLGDEFTIDKIEQAFPDDLRGISKRRCIRQKLEIEGLYRIKHQELLRRMEEIQNEESFLIPSEIDYTSSRLGLKLEEREKLSLIRPHSIAAASRIPGITPSGILRLMNYIRNHQKVNVVTPN